MTRSSFRLLLLTVLLTAMATPPSAQPSPGSMSDPNTVRLSGGITDDGELGGSVEGTRRLCDAPNRPPCWIELGLALAYVLKGIPCPAGDQWPDELSLRRPEYIVTALAGIRLPVNGLFSLRPSFGAGLARGGASELDAQTGFSAESRTAPAVSYALALDYRLTGRASLFVQARGFSIFTGEHELSGPNGSFTGDVGTENVALFSAGLGLGF